jgi:hypothetical protein
VARLRPEIKDFAGFAVDFKEILDAGRQTAAKDTAYNHCI